MKEFEKELASLINRYSKENESNTPDFILAGYIQYCLVAFNTATKLRDDWWGFKTALNVFKPDGHNEVIKGEVSEQTFTEDDFYEPDKNE